ncbi:hypothetical protein [Sinorhizobium meliloti]|uniref:Uncharacterized protein n=1 Tax=Rhizobium meliloti TaxID=382 RepID=A0AAW9TL12_RHIML|nr:hypothetical protein [Sinorhizobium meliloti]MQW32794.1 hypothetical protein [Sinorhizobium meliloti]
MTMTQSCHFTFDRERGHDVVGAVRDFLHQTGGDLPFLSWGELAGFALPCDNIEENIGPGVLLDRIPDAECRAK